MIWNNSISREEEKKSPSIAWSIAIASPETLGKVPDIEQLVADVKRSVWNSSESFTIQDAVMYLVEEKRRLTLTLLEQWRELTAARANETVLRGKLISSEISRNALIEENDALKKINTIDGLTGIPNKLATTAIIQGMINKQRRSWGYTTIFFVDADHFKKVNDGYGHMFGDQCLKEIALRLNEALRDGDVVGRFGGEEFFWAIYHENLDDRKIVAKRFLDAIGNKNILFRSEGMETFVNLTISIGMHTLITKEHASEPIEEIFEKTDKILYSAKDRGRNRAAYDDTEEETLGDMRTPFLDSTTQEPTNPSLLSQSQVTVPVNQAYLPA